MLERVGRIVLLVECLGFSLDGVCDLGFQKVVHDDFGAFDELAGEAF